MLIRNATLPDGPATRRAVIRRGKVILRRPAATATLALSGRPTQVDWTLAR